MIKKYKLHFYLVLLLLCLIINGCSSFLNKDVEVKYEVSGTARNVLLTWMNEDGGIEQGYYKLPFSKNFLMEFGSSVSLVAQNQGNSGSVKCKIYLDDVLYKESTSSGAYVLVTCNGIIGLD